MNARSVIYIIIVTIFFLGINYFFSYQNDQKKKQTPQEITQLFKEEKGEMATIPPAEQNYYVLENETLQLVFSDIGGALCEINLPFAGGQDKASVVNEIEFDRQITREQPAFAHFPAHPSYEGGDLSHKREGKLGGYYPLLRRSGTPPYYATALVSDYPELAYLRYQVAAFTAQEITFVASSNNRKITKSYRLSPLKAPYCFDLSIAIEGDSRGLWLSSGVPEVEIMSHSSSPLLQYRAQRKGKAEVDKISLPKMAEVSSSHLVHPLWICNSNGYLGVILEPLSEIGAGYKALSLPGMTVPTRLSLIDPEYEPYPPKKYPGYETFLPLSVKGGSSFFRIYAGPFEEKTLKQVDKILSSTSEGNPAYTSARTFHGWFSFIIKPFAKLLFAVMQFCYYITHSWGISIIFLTIFLRILLYPVNAWFIKSMRRMQKFSPELQAIQSKYKKDQMRLQKEMMNFYREKNVNPFMGCIPILILLIQLPFLIAMFEVLKTSFQLRGAIFIPGWIDNLTAPDVLFSWSAPIFFFGTQFHLLPFLLGAVMFLQQRISMAKMPKDPKQMTDQQRQQQVMGTIMTVLFTVMFYNFPSGLNLYWLSSTLLGVLQQWITNKFLDKKEEKPEILVPKSKK